MDSDPNQLQGKQLMRVRTHTHAWASTLALIVLVSFLAVLGPCCNAQAFSS